MRAAVVRQPGATPVLEQFTDPQPGPGVSVGTLVAAALNPLDAVARIRCWSTLSSPALYRRDRLLA